MYKIRERWANGLGEGEEGSKVGREGIEKEEEEVKSSSSVMTFVTISHHLYLTFCLITLQY